MKGSLELSVNAIVILIIALAILGLVIGFAVTKFSNLSEQLDTSSNTPNPTPQTPITLPGGGSSITLSKGSPTTLEIGIYNSGTEAINGNNIVLSCSPALHENTKFEVPAISVSAGSTASLPVYATVAGAESVGKKSCTMSIDGITRSVFLTVN